MEHHDTDSTLLTQLYEKQQNTKLNYKQISILLELYEDYEDKLKETPDDKVLQTNIKVIKTYLTKNETVKN